MKRNSFPIDMIMSNDKSTFIRRLLNKYIFGGLNGWREGTNSKEFRYFQSETSNKNVVTKRILNQRLRKLILIAYKSFRFVD